MLLKTRASGLSRSWICHGRSCKDGRRTQPSEREAAPAPSAPAIRSYKGALQREKETIYGEARTWSVFKSCTKSSSPSTVAPLYPDLGSDPISFPPAEWSRGERSYEWQQALCGLNVRVLPELLGRNLPPKAMALRSRWGFGGEMRA